MLSWIIDNASLLFLFGGFLALGLVVRWWLTRNRRYLAALGGLAGLAALVWLLTLFIDTDRKQIERTLHAMAEGMKEKPPRRTFFLISDRFESPFATQGGLVTLTKKQLWEKAQQGQRRYRIDEVRIGSLEFQSVTESQAVVTFLARPVMEGEFIPAFPCEARFAREAAGQWRMIGLKIFNPVVNTDKLFVLPL